MVDHTETLQVDFDPAILSFEELLEYFWGGHNPTRPPYSRQYMSLLLYHNEHQHEAVLRSKEAWQHKLGDDITTQIKPYETFYMAEDYHQKYALQGRKNMMKPLNSIFPSFDQFIHSTLAARLNGLLQGEGSWSTLRTELDEWALDPPDYDRVISTIDRMQQ